MEEDKKTLKEKASEAGKLAKRKIKEGFYAAKSFYYENREFLLVLTPLALGGLKIMASSLKSREDRDRKDLYVWDNRSGQQYRLRRPLRTHEQLELAQRRAEGEDVGQILLSMKAI